MPIYNRYIRLRKAIKYGDGSIKFVVPAEYKRGDLVGSSEFDSLEECQNIRTYRWYQFDIDKSNPDTYICEGYDMYYKKQKQYSVDGGEHWIDVVPFEIEKGNLYEKNSHTCGFCDRVYKWNPISLNLGDGETFICEYDINHGFDLYRKEIYQYSDDCEKTWNNVEPIQTRKGELYLENAYTCVNQCDDTVMFASCYKDNNSLIDSITVNDNSKDNEIREGEIYLSDYFLIDENGIEIFGLTHTSFVKLPCLSKCKELFIYDSSNILNLNNIQSEILENVKIINSDSFDFANISTPNLKNLSFSSSSNFTFDDFDTSNVENFDSCFNSISNSSINFDLLKCTKAKNLRYMFNNYLEGFDLSNIDLDIQNAENMEYMFNKCYGLLGVNSINWNLSKVTNMTHIFNDCHHLRVLDTANWNLPLVTDMSYAFSWCTKLPNINLDNWNTESLKDMQYMFSNCKSMTNIDFSKFNSSSVETMLGLINGTKFTDFNMQGLNFHSLSIEKEQSCQLFNTCAVENVTMSNITFDNPATIEEDIFYNMFNGINLKHVVISDWNIGQSINLSGLFYNCPNIEDNLDFSKVDLSTIEAMNDMFKQTNVKSYTMENNPLTNLKYANSMFESALNTDNRTFKFNDTSSLLSCKKMFSNCNLQGVTIDNLDLSKINYKPVYHNYGTEDMFYNSPSDVLTIDNLKFLGDGLLRMFQSMNKIDTVYLNNFNNVVDSDNISTQMGFNCPVRQMYVNNWKCKYKAHYDFKHMPNLELLHFTNMENYKPQTISIYDNVKLTDLDVSSIDTSEVSNFDLTFSGNTSIQTIDISTWKFDNSINFAFMFKNCDNLKTIIFPTDTTLRNSVDCHEMFRECPKLKNIDFSNIHNFKLNNGWNMFYGCGSLTTLDLSMIDPSESDNVMQMFALCTQLETVILDNWKLPKSVAGVQYDTMFYGCENMKTIYLRNSDNLTFERLSYKKPNRVQIITE